MRSSRNAFKQALGLRQIQIGLVSGIADTYCTDIVGGAGFDWLLIDAEHSPNDPSTVLRQLQTLAAHHVDSALRPSTATPAGITQWLDIGVQTLVLPMVESAHQAASVVEATRYPPQGRRGVGPALARAAGWGRNQKHLEQAGDEICLIAQIESPSGIAALEEIATLNGIDGILIGPSDLAATHGHPGNNSHPQVQQAIDSVIERTLACDRPVGIFVSDVLAARRYVELGCTLFIVGADTRLLAQATDTTVASFRAALAGKPTVPSNQ